MGAMHHIALLVVPPTKLAYYFVHAIAVRVVEDSCHHLPTFGDFHQGTALEAFAKGVSPHAPTRQPLGCTPAAPPCNILPGNSEEVRLRRGRGCERRRMDRWRFVSGQFDPLWRRVEHSAQPRVGVEVPARGLPQAEVGFVGKR